MRLFSTIMVIWVASSAVLFLSFLCGVEGKNSMRCSNSTKPSTKLWPSKDGVEARYILEWCTDANPNDTEWKFQLLYDRYNRNPRENLRYTHSAKTETVNWTEPLNCSYVCLSTSLDLIFNSSYTIHNWFTGRGSLADVTNHKIVNEHRRNDFTQFIVKGSDINHGDYVSVNFFLQNIPAADYFMYLCKNAREHEEAAKCSHIERNCSTPYSVYEVICKLRLPVGNYTVRLTFNAAWISGDFLTTHEYLRNINVVRGASPSVAGSGSTRAALVWALGACAALGAAALLLLLALRCRRAQHFRKQVLHDWLHREESKQAAPEARPVGPILLLYARECSAAEPIISALKALLETVAPGQVFDICSPETVALAAGDGGAWVRGVVARPDARLVLLQTPALQALHTPRLVTDDGPPRLEQPLLSRRAVYRCPAAGDWLLQFALRLLAGSGPASPAALPYRKYYLATLEGLETEALPYTVPFRRYILPRHASALLQDLQPQPQLQPQALPQPQPQSESQPESQPQPQLQHGVDELARATLDFVDYARANPDYLLDELLIL